MTIIIFILILGVLVFVHELGHFLVAKKAGIKVDEFSIGFPPRLLSKKIGETLYSVNIVPLGGYVKIYGENPDDESTTGPDSRRSFVNKNRGVQALVLSAGIASNIIFAWLLISIGLMIGLPTPVDSTNSANISNAHVVVADVVTKSPASKADIRLGDSILSLQSGTDKTVEVLNSDDVGQFVSSHGGKEITVTLLRGTETLETKVTPSDNIIQNKPAIGISMATVGILKYSFLGSFLESVKITWNLTKLIAEGIGSFFYNVFTFKADISQVSGPVGIAGMVGEAQRLGLVYLLTFTALISLNLAIINIVPFPALDGGRLLFVAIEAIIRRRINPKIQNWVNGVGFAILILLMIVVTYNDIVKLF